MSQQAWISHLSLKRGGSDDSKEESKAKAPTNPQAPNSTLVAEDADAAERMNRGPLPIFHPEHGTHEPGSFACRLGLQSELGEVLHRLRIYPHPPGQGEGLKANAFAESVQIPNRDHLKHGKKPCCDDKQIKCGNHRSPMDAYNTGLSGKARL